MLRSMTARQLFEWMDFEKLEPFGEPRADARTGILAQILANVHRDRQLHPAAYSLAEVVPQPAGDAFPPGPARQRQQSWQEMKAIGMLMAGVSWEGN